MSVNREIYCEATNGKVLSQKKEEAKVNWIYAKNYSSYI